MAQIDSRHKALVTVMTYLRLVSPCPTNCDCTRVSFLSRTSYSVICQNSEPLFLPENATEVHLLNLPRSNISENLFQDPSWSNLTHLTIEDTGPRDSLPMRYIESFAFKHLKNLRSLKLKGLLVANIDELAFSEVTSLTILNIEDIHFTRPYNLNIVAIVGKNVLPMLEELYYIPAVADILILSDDILLKVFQPKPIKLLYLSNIKLAIVDTKTFIKSFTKLHTLNVSGSVWDSKEMLSLPDSVRVLDLSWVKFAGGTLHVQRGTLHVNRYITLESNLINALANLQELYVQHMLPFETIMNGTVIDSMPNVVHHLEVLNVEHNHFIWLNCTLAVNIFSAVRQVYLGHNGVEYINPGLMNNFRKLELVDLTNNNLHLMLKYPDFGILFSGSPALTWINLSRNGLKRIPKELFINNTRLTFLDLSRNELEYIDFKIDHLIKLEFVDFRHNRIAVLHEAQRVALASLFDNSDRGLNNETGFSLDLRGNVLSCNCASLESIQFLLTTKITILHKEELQCSLEREPVYLHKETLDKVFSLCNRPTIIAGAVGFSIMVTLIICVFVTVYVYWRRHKRFKMKIETLIKQYKGLVKASSYLAFFCYCSEDVKFATDVYMEIERRLQEKLQTEEDLICIGDLHFIPGKYIVENIVKHVEMSQVVILLMSRAFCRSQWCQFEAMTALVDKKPIILMFKEHVPQHEFPTGINKIFKQYARVFCKEQANGSIKFVPTLDKVCDSIFDHVNQCTREL